MPRYQLKDPNTGRTVTINASQKPTQQDAQELFSQINQPKTQQPEAVGPNQTNVNLAKGLSDVLGLGRTVGAVATPVLMPRYKQQIQATQNLIEQQNIAGQQDLARAQQATGAERQRLLQQARQATSGLQQAGGSLGQETQAVMKAGGFRESDIGRGAVETGLRRGLGTSAELAALLLPSTQEFKAFRGANATTRAGRLGAATAQGVIQGGFQGLAKASEAENLGQAAKDVTGGAVVGGVTDLATQGLTEVATASLSTVKNQLTKTTRRIKKSQIENYKSTLKNNKANQKFYTQAGGKDQVAKEAIAMDLPKTEQGMRSGFERFKEEFENKVTKALKGRKVQDADLSQQYELALERAKKEVLSQFDNPTEPGRQAAIKNINSYFDQLQETIPGKKTADSLNRLRLGIDQSVGRKTFEEALSNPEVLAQKQIAHELRNIVKEQVPELKPLFRKYQLMAGLSEAMKVEPKFGLTEIAAGGPAGMAGLLFGGVPALASSIGSIGLARAARSPGLRRQVARTAFKLPSSQIGQITPGVVNPFLSQVFINEARRRAMEDSLTPTP